MKRMSAVRRPPDGLVEGTPEAWNAGAETPDAAGWIGKAVGYWRDRGRQASEHDLGRRVVTCLRPRARHLDAATLHSPWSVEHAAAVWPGRVKGGCGTDFLVFGGTGLGLFVADAAGWNATASAFRAMTGVLWRAYAVRGDGASSPFPAGDPDAPGRILAAIGRDLTGYVPGGRVAALYAVVDLMSGAMTYASANHAGAYVLERRGGMTMLDTRGVPLGADHDAVTANLRRGQVRLAEGQSLLLVTGGVLAAENQLGEPFGLARLERCLQTRPGCDPWAVISTVHQALTAYTGSPELMVEAAAVCVRLAARSREGAQEPAPSHAND